jgi:hypothetical membrane protein
VVPLRAAWLSQPLYVVVEVLAALATGVSYSLRDDTISALGAACPEVVVAGCSAAPLLMDVAFVVFGALQAAGAWGLLRSVTARRRSPLVVPVAALWATAGLFSIGVGLLPVDRHPTAHTLVAVPVFACQPTALLLHALLVPHRRARLVGLVLGAAAAGGALGFAVLLDAEHGTGALERLAVWPVKLWLALSVLYPAAPEADDAS